MILRKYWILSEINPTDESNDRNRIRYSNQNIKEYINPNKRKVEIDNKYYIDCVIKFEDF